MVGQSPIAATPAVGYLRGMTLAPSQLFSLTYAAIVFRRPLGVNQPVATLLGSYVLWVVCAMAGSQAGAGSAALASSIRLSQ